MKRKASAERVSSKPTKIGNYGEGKKYSQKKMGVGLEAELKYNDTSFNTDATTTGTVVSLATIGAGDTALTRDGNKIIVRSFELRVALELEAVTQNATVRMVLVRDKNPNGLQFSAFNSVFDTVSPQSLRIIGALSRFDILMDKTFCINNNSGAVQKYFFKKYVKVRDNNLISYQDGTAAVPYSNNYSLIYCSDVAAGIADVNVNGQCRMRFVG